MDGSESKSGQSKGMKPNNSKSQNWKTQRTETRQYYRIKVNDLKVFLELGSFRMSFGLFWAVHFYNKVYEDRPFSLYVPSLTFYFDANDRPVWLKTVHSPHKMIFDIILRCIKTVK